MSHDRSFEGYTIPELPSDRIPAIESTLETPHAVPEEEFTSFPDWFDPSHISTREEIKSNQYTITERCETDTGETVYFHTHPEDTPASTTVSKISRREIGYKLARTLALPTVPHAFGSSWSASLAFNGGTSFTPLFENHDRLDEFLTDFAKHIIIFNWDVSRDILVKATTADRAHIDLTPRFNNPVTAVYRLIRSIAETFLKQRNYPPGILDIIVSRAEDLGWYLCKHFTDHIDPDWFFEDWHERYRALLPFTLANLPDATPRQTGTPKMKYAPAKKTISLSENPWTPIKTQLDSI